MNTFKMHILYKFVGGPWGGGNQFLKALRDYFRKIGVYSESPEEAQVILFNSHHCLDEVFRAKKKYPNKILIHRVDGPIFYARGRDRIIDEIIFQFNNLFADGTIFQSNWSREKNYELGMRKSSYETIIMNAPDSNIFNREGKGQFNSKKVKLIATSWSANIRKGFDVYQYLDQSLDFTRYEMTFVGNSPINFKNIKWRKPVPSRELAKILKQHDIYVIASRNEACPNALIEALHCGLPAVARSTGAHPEIVARAGEFFENAVEAIDAIEKVSQNYEHYQGRIDLPTLDEVGQKYYEFAQTIYEDYLDNNYQVKQASFFGSIGIRIKTIRWKGLNELRAKIRGIRGKGKKVLP